jgi:dTDP-glucose 4,6-dehydratase/UDP-glucose 4-epimerase
VKEHVEIITGDIRDPAVVGRAVQGVDCVCHLAAVNGTRHFYERPAYVLDVGVKGMVNVLDACIRADIGDLLVASSSEVYQSPPLLPTPEEVPLVVPNPHNPRYSYGGSKIIAELMALHYGKAYFRRVIIVRPHNVFGPDMGWDHVIPQFATRLQEAKAKSPGAEIAFPIQGSGQQSRAFIYVEDFTAGLQLVLDQGKHLNIYHIGSREEISIGDLAQRVARCMGLRVHIVPGPAAEGETERRCPDISKLERLGFRPRFTLEQGLPPTVAWYVAHPAPASGKPKAPDVYLGA